jgi:hypothetical protein
MKHRNHRHWTLALGAAGLVACGGGGGDAGAPTSPAAPVVTASAITITPGNAGGLTAEAVDAGTAGAAGSGATLLTGVEVQADARPATSRWRTLSGLLRQAASSGAAPLVVGVAVNSSLFCSGGGSIAVTGNVAVAGSAGVGDSLQLVFNNCRETDIGLITGSMALTFVQTTADLSFYVADASLNNLTLTVGSRVERLSGGLRLSLDERSFSQSVVEATSTSLAYTRLVNGTVRAQQTLTDYTYRGVTAASNGQTSETFSYAATGNVPSLGNNIAWTAATTQPLVTPAGAEHPTSGAGRIVGANGKSVVVTVTPTGVRLDIDHSGDAGVDTTTDLTWAQFDALL